MNQLRLWLEHENDGTGELFAEVVADGFSGKGSAWFNTSELMGFGQKLSQAFPLSPSETYELQGGFWSKESRSSLEQVHVGLRFYPVGTLGAISCQVKLSSQAQVHDRRESQSSVTVELQVSYEELRAFGLSVVSLAESQCNKVILKSA